MKNILLLGLCTVMFIFGLVGVAGAMTYADTYITEVYLCFIALFLSLA